MIIVFVSMKKVCMRELYMSINMQMNNKKATQRHVAGLNKKRSGWVGKVGGKNLFVTGGYRRIKGFERLDGG